LIEIFNGAAERVLEPFIFYVMHGCAGVWKGNANWNGFRQHHFNQAFHTDTTDIVVALFVQRRSRRIVIGFASRLIKNFRCSVVGRKRGKLPENSIKGSTAASVSRIWGNNWGSPMAIEFRLWLYGATFWSKDHERGFYDVDESSKRNARAKA
jgi:hypothetical protein